MTEEQFFDDNHIKIHKFISIDDFNHFPFKLENIGSLSGCFDIDNTLG